MKMAGGVGLILGLIAVVFVQHYSAAQTVHVVGNTTGWTLPQGGAAFYSDWAAKNHFVVGDSLTFNFATNSHDVLRLITKESFDACCADHAIDKVIATGPTTLKLDTVGVHYFICTIGRHCLEGQKLSVNVVAATPGSGSVLPPSSNTPLPSPRTPSHDDAFAPTPTTPPANSPSSSPPSNDDGSQLPPPPPSSSTTVIMGTLYVTLSAVFMNLLF